MLFFSRKTHFSVQHEIKSVALYLEKCKHGWSQFNGGKSETKKGCANQPLKKLLIEHMYMHRSVCIYC